MHKNVVFRGCTRPAMFLGVPYLPFFLIVGGTFLLSLYTRMWVMAAIPLEIFILRQMARRDEMIFRMLGLKLQFHFKVRNVGDHAGNWVFSPRRPPALSSGLV
ncbi:VirB3 family type IV secretion system protein [Xanthomonas campestris pv. campestris]|uniref:type IV secretion system protein VirB3 n=1 Tax=Xanthomonas campestris TaxID=339 RepID=UPI0032E48292